MAAGWTETPEFQFSWEISINKLILSLHQCRIFLVWAWRWWDTAGFHFHWCPCDHVKVGTVTSLMLWWYGPLPWWRPEDRWFILTLFPGGGVFCRPGDPVCRIWRVMWHLSGPFGFNDAVHFRRPEKPCISPLCWWNGHWDADILWSRLWESQALHAVDQHTIHNLFSDW